MTGTRVEGKLYKTSETSCDSETAVLTKRQEAVLKVVKLKMSFNGSD